MDPPKKGVPQGSTRIHPSTYALVDNEQERMTADSRTQPGSHWDMSMLDNRRDPRTEKLRIDDWIAEKKYRSSNAKQCARTLVGKHCEWLKPTGQPCSGCQSVGAIWDHASMWLDRSNQHVLVLQPYLPSTGPGGVNATPMRKWVRGMELLENFCTMHDLLFVIDSDWSWHYPGWTTLIELRSAIPRRARSPRWS